MISGYTKNKSVQILIALLKEHGIRRAIISPGTTNLEFTAGLQYDGGFELYSAVDERSAAYMACGIASRTGEPVIISCTEATASRDYFPGLTEAYYRKLPIIAVTGVHRYNLIGHLQPQIIDRSVSPKDLVREKVQLPIIKDKEDVWETELLVNKALLALKRHGGGPVHIDLPCCNQDYLFDVKELPKVKKIEQYSYGDTLPAIPEGKIAIFIGSHKRFDEEETTLIDNFCSIYDAVVFCDHTSGYKGQYAFHAGLLSYQKSEYSIFSDIRLLIHLGEPTGDGSTMERFKNVERVWRVSPDGELRDTFKKLEKVFEMTEKSFFAQIVHHKQGNKKTYYYACKELADTISLPLDELPFSNIYIAAKIAPKIPENSFVQIGVSNTIRAWTFVDFPDSVETGSNVGCRGIDGIMSALIGGALVDPQKLHFCILGDLTFFYDMNSLGNRDIKNNVRILLINNNGGGVMKLSGAPGHRFFGDEIANQYIAAAGHFGNGSPVLVKSYVEALGFEYLTASSKEEFEKVYSHFITPEIVSKPMVFEVFIDAESDRNAFSMVSGIDVSVAGAAKQIAKQLLGNRGISFVKNLKK